MADSRANMCPHDAGTAGVEAAVQAEGALVVGEALPAA